MRVTLLQLSDLHFGRDADLAQIAALEALTQAHRPDAVVLAGDLTQRARHGELQRARAFAEALARSAAVLAIPGNHDVQWWASPFGLRGSAPLYAKYVRYFGPELAPTLEIPGAVLAGALTSHGLALASMTWNLNDMCVKGHLPATEAARLAAVFAAAPPDAARVAVLHHNVLRGQISRRMGLARWRAAQQALVATGADLVLCGHDHQEGSGQLEGRLVVSTASTHTSRTRGGRASACNLVTIEPTAIVIQHLRWERGLDRFVPGDQARYARAPRR